MKRPMNSLCSVVGLAAFALLGLTACPQENKEEGKAAPAAAAQPTPAVAPAAEGAVAPAVPPAAVNPAAAPAGEELKADPAKADPGATKEAAK